MELLKFTIKAGETKRFEKSGRYLEIIDSFDAITLGLYDSNGSNTDDALGAYSGLYLEGQFSAIEVYSAVAQTVTLLVTDGRGGSRRQPGFVQIVDSTRQLVQMDRKFLNTATTGVPAAGQFAQVQIWNGEAAKGVAISALTITNSTSAGTLEMMGNGAQLAGATVIPTSSKRLVAAGQLQNTKVQTVRKIDALTGGVPGIPSGLTGAASYLLSISAGAQQTRLPMQDGPFVLGPGTGLVIAHTVAASMLQIIVEGEIFDWTS